MELSSKRIILSKTNQIGDVLMGLAVANYIKSISKNCEIYFLSTSYTKDLIDYFPAVYHFLNWDELKRDESQAIETLKSIKADIIIHLRAQKQIARIAKRADIPLRIGSMYRIYNWIYCSKLMSISRSKWIRKHDVEFDLDYLKAIIPKYSKPDMRKIQKLLEFEVNNPEVHISKLIDPKKFNLILHPKTATQLGKREWPVERYIELVQVLPKDKYKIFVTGTESEGKLINNKFKDLEVCLLTGKFSVSELIQLISCCDGLVAASTGPLHIAAALGIHTLGFFTQLVGESPTRWGPIGKKAQYIVSDPPCQYCLSRNVDKCECIQTITASRVLDLINGWLKKNN